MIFSRRRFIKLSSSLLAAPAIIGSLGARAQDTVTLRLHHFLPPVANGHARLLQPWADKIRAESEGRIQIDIFPGMQLGGTPVQLYDQARDGVVDIVWTLPGNTPGRFPSTEVFELPFIAGRTATTNARACQEFADNYLTDEVSDVKLLSFWAHDQGLIHANKPIETMEDFRGLRLRSPTRLAGEALTVLGATTIGMPIPQVPEALAQRVIDGCVVPWEVVPSLKLEELVRFHTQIPGSPTLYTASFFLAMNRDRFDRLPDDLKTIIEDNSGMAFASMAGQMWDEVGANVAAVIANNGVNAVSTISEAEKARWIEATLGEHSKWAAEAGNRGVDGDALIAAARALVAKHDAA